MASTPVCRHKAGFLAFRWRPTSRSPSACWRCSRFARARGAQVFVVAYAVIDDLGAIIIIALFYSKQLSLPYLFGALGVFAVLIAFNRLLRWMTLTPHLIGASSYGR